jgi:hypothetical protein
MLPPPLHHVPTSSLFLESSIHSHIASMMTTLLALRGGYMNCCKEIEMLCYKYTVIIVMLVEWLVAVCVVERY